MDFIQTWGLSSNFAHLIRPSKNTLGVHNLTLDHNHTPFNLFQRSSIMITIKIMSKKTTLMADVRTKPSLSLMSDT
jgi:hypothetical protein